MKFLKRKDPVLDSDLRILEEKLKNALQPVSPGQDFVNGLYTRLLERDFPPVPKLIPQRISNTLLIIGGVVGSLVMIVTSIRGLISLINMMGSILKKQQTTLV